MTSVSNQHLVAIVGAGPAGIYASRVLAAEGVHVVLLNRDIKWGGLAEYGIYYDKYKMKDGLSKPFERGSRVIGEAAKAMDGRNLFTP